MNPRPSFPFWTAIPLYLLALLAYGLWLGGRLPYHNDILAYVYPEASFNLESASKGWIPFWNPYLICGVPHLANWLSAFFYPPYWIMALTGISQGLVGLALLHEAWAFAGFYLWARSQKTEGWVAALGALSFAGSAHFIRCWVCLHFIATASWIPWVFWAVGRALEQPGVRKHLLAVLALSLQMLAGYPIFVFYTWVLLLLWVVFKHPLKLVLRRVLLLLGVSLLLTAFQWLPFMEFLAYASRGGWNPFPYYIHFKEYLTLLQPTLLGIPGASNYQGDASNSLFGCLYFGLFACLIWIISLFGSKSWKGFWPPVSLLLLIWMAGPSIFLWKFIPAKGFDLLEPSKAVGLFVFAACTSVCLLLGRDLPVVGRKRPGWVIALALLWAAELLILPLRLIYRVPDPFDNPAWMGKAGEIRYLTEGKRFLALQLNSGTTPPAPNIDEAVQTTLSEFFPVHLLPNTNMVWGLRSPAGYLSLQTANYRNLSHYYNRFPYQGDLLDVAGIRIFVLPQPLPQPKYRPVMQMGEDFISLDPQASKDMRWVGQFIELPDRPSVLNALSTSHSRWRQRVYLDKNGEGTLAQFSPAPRPLAMVPVQGYERPCANRASYAGLAPSEGFIVFNESYTPGWHAWVDGIPQPILRAYGLFMAAAIPKGPHQVDFRYEPATFRLGLFITFLTLAGTLALFLGSFSSSRLKKVKSLF